VVVAFAEIFRVSAGGWLRWLFLGQSSRRRCARNAGRDNSKKRRAFEVGAEAFQRRAQQQITARSAGLLSAERRAPSAERKRKPQAASRKPQAASRKPQAADRGASASAALAGMIFISKLFTEA
jgi:hypothetical protein